MAPKKNATSFLHLELEVEEETKLKALLEYKDIRGKQLLRTLVRGWMKEPEQENIYKEIK